MGCGVWCSAHYGEGGLKPVSDQISFAGILYQAKSYCEAAKLAERIVGHRLPSNLLRSGGLAAFRRAA